MINVSCRFSVPLGRYEGMDYIRRLELSIMAFDELGKEVVLGRIAGDQLLLADVEVDDENLFDICDEDSQGMYELYEALFQQGNQFHPDLGIDESAEQILFLWHSVLHEKLRPYEQAIIEVVSNLFGCASVVVMWRDVTHLTNRELAELGFSKIAWTEFVFRHVALQTHFTKAHPRGIEVPLEFEATKNDEELVLNLWNKFDEAILPEQEGNSHE
jgi:hypothetical protein